MGLVVCVGMLVDLGREDEEGVDQLRGDLNTLNDVLREHGLEEHKEPESALWEPISFDMYGYSGLHYLRRLAAHLDTDGLLPPPGDESASEDPVLGGYYERLDRRSGLLGRFRRAETDSAGGYDHLMNHSDAEGFYVPQPFAQVLRAPKVTGGLVGSAVSLRDELRRIEEALGIPASLDPEDDELWEATESQGDGDAGWQQYGIESFTCARLLAAAEASIERGAAIVFA
jgi:hypothetical protein